MNQAMELTKGWGYAQVRVVQHKKTKALYALKYINKARISKQRAVNNVSRSVCHFPARFPEPNKLSAISRSIDHSGATPPRRDRLAFRVQLAVRIPG